MKEVNIKARVRRNKLDFLAGENYRDENSEIVRFLNNANKKALLGVQRNDGVYTIIGKENIYYSTVSGIENTIPHKYFLDTLKKNAFSLGKTGEFEFLKISDNNFIWLFNAQTMNAIWNTVLALADRSSMSE